MLPITSCMSKGPSCRRGIITDLNRPPDVVAAIQRTIEAEERLDNDLVRICCWIEERHSIQPVKIELQRHHGCADNAVAHVVPLARDQAPRRTIRGEAKTVLRALGWVVKPEGKVPEPKLT